MSLYSVLTNPSSITLDEENTVRTSKTKAKILSANICVFGRFGCFSSLSTILTADLILEGSDRSVFLIHCHKLHEIILFLIYWNSCHVVIFDQLGTNALIKAPS